MNVLNVANLISEWVENKLNLPFTIYNDVIPDTETEESCCLRHDPSAAAEKRFIDGSRQVQWNLCFYVRSSNRQNARNYAYSITDTLDGARIVDSETGIEIDVEAQTLPQFINVDEKNNTLYSASILATYLEKTDE